MKLALVHDYLTQYGGAERVLESLSKVWAGTPIYTSIADMEQLEGQGLCLYDNDIHTSFMQRLPFKREFSRTYYLPLYPLAFENFVLDEYDVVLSVSSYASKGVITKPETLHICYCCTPPRHLWNFDEYTKYHYRINRFYKSILTPIISYLRVWDFVSATRVDKFIAISTAVQERIQHTYNRESIIVYPPVDIKKMRKISPVPPEKDYFLIVSRLGGHKRVDLAIKAFNELKEKKLVIIGEGSMGAAYEQMAGENIIFKGHLNDKETVGYCQNALAFLYPQEEDFGITAVEAQAAGIPVIGYDRGGIRDTVIDGKTGIYFHRQEVDDVVTAIKDFNKERFNPNECRKNAENFSEDTFKKKIKEVVAKEYERYNSSRREKRSPLPEEKDIKEI